MCPILFLTMGGGGGPTRKGWLVSHVRVGSPVVIVTESSGLITTSLVQEVIVADSDQLVCQTLNRRYLLMPAPGHQEQWHRLCGDAQAAVSAVSE
jgi:hypothetical protein